VPLDQLPTATQLVALAQETESSRLNVQPAAGRQGIGAVDQLLPNGLNRAPLPGGEPQAVHQPVGNHPSSPLLVVENFERVGVGLLPAGFGRLVLMALDGPLVTV